MKENRETLRTKYYNWVMDQKSKKKIISRNHRKNKEVL